MEGNKDNYRDEGTSDHHIPVVQHKSTSSIPSADSGKGSNVTTVTKRRKMIQMNDAQCLSHSMTSEGAMPLTNPKPQGLSKSRNWDANRGLYPRQNTSRRHWSPNKGNAVRGQGHSALLGSPRKQGRMDTYFPISPNKKSPNSDAAYHRDYSQTDPNHTHSQSYNRQNGQGHSALLGSPKKQGRMDTYFPVSPKKSPKKSPNSDVAYHRDYSQTDPNHTYSQSYNGQNGPSTSSLRSPRKYTQATLGTPPAYENDQTCPQGIYFPKPQGCIKKTPKKSFSTEMQCMETSTVSNAGSSGMGQAVTLTSDDKPSSKAAHHAPVKALFQTKGPSRKSTDLVRAFEEDVLITTEMFDHATGNINQDKQTSRDKPGCSSSLDKEFEDDDFFTAEDFDEVLQSSQGRVKTEGNHRKTTDFEKALEEEDLTAEEFDDILQSSQSPVKNGAFKYSPKKTTYGLLGDDDQSFSDDVEDDVDYFSRLPDEILENILGQLPILDMCLTASSVCKRWHSIISRERFTPWKKRYHQMKKVQNDDYIQEIDGLISDGSRMEKRACLMQLIGYMMKLRVSETKSAIDYLKGHPRYSEAEEVMKARTPHVFENQDPHPWSTVATIVILSQSAQEVCCIVDCLLLRKDPIPRVEVSECLYCLASAFFLFQKKFKINRGLHYRVFHALHILESAGAGNNEEMSDTARRSNKGHQSLQDSLLRNGQREGLNLTPEQLRIINHFLLPTDVIKIIAFAGTGKTTTLIQFAQMRPHLSFLYIAFNKTVQQQAVEKFPSNVECRTLHSLAYKAVGFRYRNKLSSMLKPFFITSLLPKKPKIKKQRRGGGGEEEKGMHHMTLAKHVCTTINHFLSSDDGFITTAHVPAIDTSRVPRQALDHSVRMDIAKAAESVFQALCDVNNKETKITHDVYMKLYELQHPQLEGYDCLLIDEAQDLTLAQQSILLTQKCAKILVGDPHQQIYSFRGATNAMARVQATRMYHLTQSFRFGPQIAYVANCLLEVLKQQTKSTIIGAGPQGQISGGRVGQLATICRSNATVFTEAVKMVTNDENVKIQFSGGYEGYGFDKILDLYYLSLPPAQRGSYRIKDKFISRFESMNTVQSYAKMVDDMELQSRMKLVFQYHSRIPMLVQKIKKSSVRFDGAYLLTTAHKAKGLEYDTVRITDDFLSDPLEQQTVGTQSMEDEKNILYVAVTRAKKSLQLNRAIKNYLSKVEVKFEYPVLAKKLKREKGPQRCQECGKVQDDDNQLLLLERKHIKLTHSVRDTSVEGGIVCHNCVEAPGFEELYGKPPPTAEELRAMELAEIAEQNPGIFVNV